MSRQRQRAKQARLTRSTTRQVLWCALAVLAASCAGQLQVEIKTAADATGLTAALLKATAGDSVHVAWLADIAIQSSIPVPDGVSLSVAGSSGGASISGGGLVQLFKVSGSLNLTNLILQDGYTQASGGAVASSPSAQLHIEGCAFVGNQADMGGAIAGGSLTSISKVRPAVLRSLVGFVSFIPALDRY